jgi:hypothetical protein
MPSDNRKRGSRAGHSINLGQLAAEVGTPLAMNDDDVVIVDPDTDVTQEELDDAIAAHVADPDYGMPVDEVRMRELAAMETLDAGEQEEAVLLLLQRLFPTGS